MLDLDDLFRDRGAVSHAVSSVAVTGESAKAVTAKSVSESSVSPPSPLSPAENSNVGSTSTRARAAGRRDDLRAWDCEARALAILADNPRACRAVVADASAPGEHVPCVVALRGVGIACLSIPRERFDELALLELLERHEASRPMGNSGSFPADPDAVIRAANCS